MAITNQNYKILVDAQLSTSTINKQLSELGRKTKSLKIGTTATEAKSITDNIYSGLRNFNNIVNVVQTTVQLVQSLTEAVFELNDATTEFRKVSDLNGKALDAYIDKASKLGDTVARTTSELMSGATEFRKSGFNDEDSLILAQVAAQFQNVADSELSAGDAASVIISNLKAFNMTAEDSTKIIDVINEISNSYAISSTDLSLGLSKTASAMATLGNSFEESVALMVGAGEQMPHQSGKIARGLRSIGLEIAKQAQESDKLSTGYNGITVALKNQDGSLRSTYDILSDLYPTWQKMSDAQKSTLGISVAGKQASCSYRFNCWESLKISILNKYSNIFCGKFNKFDIVII